MKRDKSDNRPKSFLTMAVHATIDLSLQALYALDFLDGLALDAPYCFVGGGTHAS